MDKLERYDFFFSFVSMHSIFKQQKVQVTSLSSNTCKACIKWVMQKNTLTIVMKCCIKYLHMTRHDAMRRDIGHHYTRSRAEMPLCYLKFLGRTLFCVPLQRAYRIHSGLTLNSHFVYYLYYLSVLLQVHCSISFP